MKGDKQNSEGELTKIFANYAQAGRAIFLSSAVVGLALIGFIVVMRHVDDNNAILVYARHNLLISLAGASALYVVLVALMTWVILRFINTS